MSFLFVTWSRNLLKLHSDETIRGNTYKNEIIAYLHMTWPKLQPLKLLWWKTPISTEQVIFDYMISCQMKRAYAVFTKPVRHHIWWKKHRKKHIYSLGSKFIWSVLHPEMNYLLGSYGSFCQGWRVRGRLNCFQILFFHPFF